MEKEKTVKEVNGDRVNRDELSLQRFFDDMSMIGRQVNSSQFKKPSFHYGDLSITNYLLWLMLAELMMLNDKQNVGELNNA